MSFHAPTSGSVTPPFASARASGAWNSTNKLETTLLSLSPPDPHREWSALISWATTSPPGKSNASVPGNLKAQESGSARPSFHLVRGSALYRTNRRQGGMCTRQLSVSRVSRGLRTYRVILNSRYTLTKDREIPSLSSGSSIWAQLGAHAPLPTVRFVCGPRSLQGEALASEPH